MIDVNKIEDRTKFKIRTGFYLEFLTPETVKLVGSTKNKITKDENGENVPNLEIAEVVSIHCNTVSKFSYIEVWFTDQNSKLLEIEDKINITLIINESVKYKK